jgi:hypothetical protein
MCLGNLEPESWQHVMRIHSQATLNAEFKVPTAQFNNLCLQLMQSVLTGYLGGSTLLLLTSMGIRKVSMGPGRCR